MGLGYQCWVGGSGVGVLDLGSGLSEWKEDVFVLFCLYLTGGLVLMSNG